MNLRYAGDSLGTSDCASAVFFERLCGLARTEGGGICIMFPYFLSGCAAVSSILPPRSPKARDRGHPQLNNARYETGATRPLWFAC